MQDTRLELRGTYLPERPPLRHSAVMALRSDLAKRVAEMLRQLSSRDLFLVLAALPIIALLVLAPETFELFWSGGGKLGRGGLFFILFFLAFDLLDFPKAKIEWTRGCKIIVSLTVAVGVLYFIEVAPGQT
jgi:hypothetical protein